MDVDKLDNCQSLPTSNEKENHQLFFSCTLTELGLQYYINIYTYTPWYNQNTLESWTSVLANPDRPIQLNRNAKHSQLSNPPDTIQAPKRSLPIVVWPQIRNHNIRPTPLRLGQILEQVDEMDQVSN